MRSYDSHIPSKLLLAVLCMVAIAGPVSAQVTDLGSLSHPSGSSIPNAINNSGHVVGWSTTGRVTLKQAHSSGHAFLYSNGQMVDLGTLGGQFSQANGLNDRGAIVGWSETAKVNDQGLFTTHAFLYFNGKMSDLGSLGGGYSVANGVNNLGEVVGWSEAVDGTPHAFIYSNGTMTDMMSLASLGGDSSFATAVNDAGEIVGGALLPDNITQRAFLFSAGKMFDLGTLGGEWSQANAINSFGDIVGWSETATKLTNGGFQVRPFFRSSKDRRMIELGRFSNNYLFVTAMGINTRGDIVGFGAAKNGEFPSTPFVYSNGHFQKPFGHAKAFSATGINDSGQIIGAQLIQPAHSELSRFFGFLYSPKN